MLDSVFYQIAILLLCSVLVGAISMKLRQPLLMAFIAVGIVAGPSVLNWAHSTNTVDIFAQMGITLLLFIVGLKLDIHLIRSLGKSALLIGVVQILVTTILAYLLTLVLGFRHTEALYIALSLTFSSTIIIIKLLSDKAEIDSLYGRIALGVLIMQDLVVILFIIILSSIGMDGLNTQSLNLDILMLILKGFALFAYVYFIMRFVFPKLLSHLAKSHELLVLFAIAWAIALAALCEYLGFSKEVGGFIAGVSLASTFYRESIASKLETLRNFLLLFYFIELGSHIHVQAFQSLVLPAIVLCVFVLLAKPLITMIIMGVMGFTKRTSFQTGLTLAQISEFSLILTSMGVRLGHIPANILDLITFTAIITIGISSYLILYNNALFSRFRPWLSFFEKKQPSQENFHGHLHIPADVHIAIFGLGRFGGNIIRQLSQQHRKILGIDFNPKKVKKWGKYGVFVRYGDIEDVEFIRALPLQQLQLIISTIPYRDINTFLFKALKENDYQGNIAITTHSETDRKFFLALGVQQVLLPYKDAALLAAERLSESLETQPPLY